MKQLALTMIIAAAALAQAAAQTDDGQVLVYRSTGDINLFFADEIDSITVSDIDADSVRHDGPVSQVFHTADTTLVVPLAEIDSVAFGSRNEVSFREGVRQIAADSTWIVRYDGSCIYYRPDTPADILPSAGQRLFYGVMDRRFTSGLAAVVTSVTRQDGEYAVAVSPVELDEVFTRLFFAGKIGQTATEGKPHGQGRAPINFNRDVSGELPLGDFGSLSVGGSLTIDGKAVVAPLRGYYNIDAVVKSTFKSGVTLTAANADTGSGLSANVLTVPLGVFAAVFRPELSVDLFAEIKGEMKFDTEFSRTASAHVVWTRQRGQEDKFSMTNADDSEEGYKDEAKIEVLCDGSLYLGINPVFDLKIVGDVAGARAKLWLGPALSGQVGFSMVSSLTRYDGALYGKASLDACLRLRTTGTVYHRTLLWGEEKETGIFSKDFDFMERKLNLFPEYYATKGIKFGGKDEAEVSAATKSKTPILKELQTGFEIADAQGNAVDSVFADTIRANTDSVQGVAATFALPAGAAQPEKELVLRPIFRYAGVTVRAANAAVMDDMQLQPMVFALGNGASTCLSGMPFSGSASNDSTLFTAGPHLPVPARDTVFTKPGPIAQGVYLGDENDITGTWTGNECGADVAYTFNADGTGTFTGADRQQPFTYRTDTPQAGGITMAFAAGGTKVIRVTFFSPQSMSCTAPPATEKFILNRQ